MVNFVGDVSKIAQFCFDPLPESTITSLTSGAFWNCTRKSIVGWFCSSDTLPGTENSTSFREAFFSSAGFLQVTRTGSRRTDSRSRVLTHFLIPVSQVKDSFLTFEDTTIF